MKWHMTAISEPLYEAADIIDAQQAEIESLRDHIQSARSWQMMVFGSAYIATIDKDTPNPPATDQPND
jgi:hypothetical protein